MTEVGRLELVTKSQYPLASSGGHAVQAIAQQLDFYWATLFLVRVQHSLAATKNFVNICTSSSRGFP